MRYKGSYRYQVRRFDLKIRRALRNKWNSLRVVEGDVSHLVQEYSVTLGRVTA